MLSTVVIEVPAEAVPAAASVAVNRCAAALGKGRCLTAGESHGSSHYALIDADDPVTTIRIQLRRGSATGELIAERQLTFATTDSQDSRWESAGLVIASLVVADDERELRSVGLPNPGASVAVRRRAASSSKPLSRFAVGVGAGAEHSPGGFGPSWLLGASLIATPLPRLSIVIDGMLTPERIKLRSALGEASGGLFFAGLATRFCILDPASRFRSFLGGGAWLGIAILNGKTAAPYVGRREISYSVVPHLDLGIRFDITRRLTVGAGVGAALSMPRVSVDFVDRHVADWGRPIGLGTIAVETALD